MTRFKFSDSPIRSQRRGHANEREVVMNSLVIDVATNLGVQQQRPEFRAENQLTVQLRIQQGLFTDPVARQKKRFRSLVPNREGKHAVQILRTVRAVLVIGPNDRLGVAIGMK